MRKMTLPVLTPKKTLGGEPFKKELKKALAAGTLKPFDANDIVYTIPAGAETDNGTNDLSSKLNPTQEQDAALVAKLSPSFPIQEWDSMSIKAQRQAMKFSGLAEPEQWRLLNSSAPLSVLDAANRERIRPVAPTGPGKSTEILTNPSKTPYLQNGESEGQLGKELNSGDRSADFTKVKLPSITPNPAIKNVPKPGPSPTITDQRILLQLELTGKVNRDLSFLERVKGFNTTGKALDIVMNNEGAIRRIADRYEIPASYIKTIMFREQRFIDARDTIADFVVEHNWREQSSTGIMQVTTRTAIEAINYVLNEGSVTLSQLGLSGNHTLSFANPVDRRMVWQKLRSDPDFNIEVASQIIHMNAVERIGNDDFTQYNAEDIIRLFSLYNGSGDAALEYGKECYDWLLSFEKYDNGGE